MPFSPLPMASRQPSRTAPPPSFSPAGACAMRKWWRRRTAWASPWSSPASATSATKPGTDGTFSVFSWENQKTFRLSPGLPPVLPRFSHQEPGDGEPHAGHSGDDAQHREHALARNEVQRAEHQSDLQQPLADVVAQGAVLVGFGSFVGALGLFLDLLAPVSYTH